MRMKSIVLTVGTAAALALSAPALADPGKGKGNNGKPAHAGGPGKSGKHGGGNGPHGHDSGGLDVDVNIGIGTHFTDAQRENTYNYYRNHSNCPPGLAKKNNGCLPPGQAKKRYSIGQPIPDGIHIDIVPDDLRKWIGPPPHGHYYGYVDGDLLLVANATHRVVDAIVAIDAAANALSN